MSITGRDASFGEASLRGARLAVEQINAAGGVLGRPLALVVEDNRSVAGESATAAKKLITRDRVVALVGECSSARTLEAAPVAQAAGVPLVTPASTSPRVTAVGDAVFRVCFIDPFQGEVLASFARRKLGLRRAALLVDAGSPYSTGLAEYFSRTFAALGGEVVATQRYAGADTDFRAQLTAIRAAGADAASLPDDMIIVARDMGPAELLDYDRARLRGLVLEEGSALSHVAIVARALDIPVVGRAPDVLSRIEPGITKAVINGHMTPVAAFVLNGDMDLGAEAMMKSIRDAAGDEATAFVDGTGLATAILGDSIATNLFMLGYAWQKGLLPLSLDALHRAIELNGVAVETSKRTFAWGRLAAHNLAAVQAAARKKDAEGSVMSDDERRKLVSTEQSLGMAPEARIPSGLEIFGGAQDEDKRSPADFSDAESFFNLPQGDDEDEEDVSSGSGSNSSRSS